MPEHDMVKHTKAIYDAVREPGKSWKHKIGDILVEIAIIVFAISLSLLLERWRENAHDATTEKKFLLGLRSDLQNDIRQLKADSATYHGLYTGWNYLRKAGINKTPLNKDSVNLYANSLLNTVDFNPSNSRFEALKSSGQVNVIENDSLQNLILDLYQNKIAILKASTTYITLFKTEQVRPFLSKNFRFSNDGSSNLQQLVELPEMQNYLYFGNVSLEIMQRYHDAIDESIMINKMIDKQYKK